MLFVIPWGDYSLVGTTDTEFHGDPDSARAERADVEYLLAEVRALFPGAPLSEAEIATTFTGVRSLLASDSRRRRHAHANIASSVMGKTC